MTPARPHGAARRRSAAAGAAGMLGLVLALSSVPPAGAAPFPVRMAAEQEECTSATRIEQAPPALAALQSEAVWARTRGAGVTVAVVDSGVAAANPHLSGALVGGVNLVPDGTDPAGTTDVYGHGTAIAGQIAAREIPGSGIVGLAPEARILPVRVYTGVESQLVEAGFGLSAARTAEGIRYAADQGAQIINVSISTAVPDPVLGDAVLYATSRGSLVVGSAGNRDATLAVEQSDEEEGDGARYPAGFIGAIGVAATDPSGVVTEASVHGPHVGLAAPGQEIFTTSAVGGDCAYAQTAPYTSYAAGYVSAAAALVAAAFPDETPEQWAYRLQATAVRPDPDARDDTAGWGVVQPFDALALVPGSGVRGPVSPFATTPAPEPEPASAQPVAVAVEQGPDAAAIQVATTTGIGALVALAAVGAIGVFVARRRADGDGRAANDYAGRRGLYGDSPDA